jgi:hypothetical protein
MKATNALTYNILKSLLIIISFFSIQISSLYAGNNNYNPSPVPSVNNLIQALAPASPSTCDFNDAELQTEEISHLAPIVPSEADFSDATDFTCNITPLAPATPSEADFND